MLKRILKFRLVGSVFLSSFLFVSAGMIWAYFALRRIVPPLIIHFNNLTGINQTGDLTDLLKVGVTGIVFVLMNFFIALELEERDIFGGKLLAAATFFVSALIFIGFAAIISVN